MKSVTYHDPTIKRDLPAFIIGRNNASKKEGRKKPSVDLLVCGVPGNFIVENVGAGKGVRQYTA